MENDETLLRCFKENNDRGNDMLYLFVEPLAYTLEPLLEEPTNDTNNNFSSNSDGDSDDPSYNVFDRGSLGLRNSKEDDFIESEDSREGDDSSD